jgi:hypothetical protein
MFISPTLNSKILKDHHLCPGECSQAFVVSSLNEPSTGIPPKCSVCKTVIVGASFERQLNNEQLNQYLSYVAMKTIGPDEKITNCPFCNYFEVWPRGFIGMDILFCSGCNTCSCVHCNLKCEPPSEKGYDADFASAQIRSDSSSYLYHMECAELAPFKQSVDEAIEKGTGRVCPGCKQQGRKNEDCTHMTCINCRQVWCYVCGLPENSCDKEDPNGNIYSHNEDWDINPRRCPMYLTAISEIDGR